MKIIPHTMKAVANHWLCLSFAMRSLSAWDNPA
jgi:hypothetical protein